MSRHKAASTLGRATETAVLALAGTSVLLWAPLLIAWTAVAAFRDRTAPALRSFAAVGRGSRKGAFG